MSDLNLIEQLTDEIVEAVQDENPSLARLEKLLQDVKDMPAQPYYRQLALDQQKLLRDAREDLEAKIKELRSTDGGIPGGNGIYGSGGVEPGGTDDGEGQVPAEPIHDPKADDWMSEAESTFYAGKYNEAINFYNEVLKIEPAWERACQHRAQAQEYLRSGHIPTDALPPEAAIKFGKAQSAARVMSLKRARELYDDAKKVLAEHDITKFVEGQQFEEKLNNAEEAESTYKKGLEIFNQGRVDEAINSIQLAADLAGMPLYKEKVSELREVSKKIKQMRQMLFARPPVPELVLQASATLSELQATYGDNLRLGPLFTQLEITTSQVIEQLFEKIDKYLYELAISTSISGSTSVLEQAADAIVMLEKFGKGNTASEIRFSRECRKLDEIKADLDAARQFLLQANDALAKHDSNAATEIHQYLKSLFPWDRDVLALGEKIEKQRGNVPGKNRSNFKSNFRLERLAELLRADPTNPDLLLNYEWERLHYQLNKRDELFRQDRMVNARALHQQSNFWFYASIVTAVLFLLIAIVLIWLSFDRQNPWTAASSLLSLIPVLATKLIYQQALQANERADQLFEKIYSDNKQDQEMERQLFEHIRSRLFSEAQLHTSPSERKPEENRNT